MDLVLQHELALLQAFELELIRMDVERETSDHLVQITMLNAQRPQFLYVAEQLAVDVVFDFRHGGLRLRSPMSLLAYAARRFQQDPTVLPPAARPGQKAWFLHATLERRSGTPLSAVRR